MTDKRTSYFGIRFTDAERRRLELEAGRKPLAAAIRERLFSGDAPPGPAPGPAGPAEQPAALQVHHVDEIGPDPWRRDNGALSK